MTAPRMLNLRESVNDRGATVKTVICRAKAGNVIPFYLIRNGDVNVHDGRINTL